MLAWQAAGSSKKLFRNAPHARDCDAHGVLPSRRLPSGEGMRLNDFVLCRRAALTIPLTYSDVLVLSHFEIAAPQPPAPMGPGGSTDGNRHPADASTSPSQVQRIKGAPARKAAAAAARDKLSAARQAALEAKARVADVGGELYYFFSAALAAAEAADALARGVAGQGDCERASGAMLLVRYPHPGVTADEVRELFSRVAPPIYVRMQISTVTAVPKTTSGLEYNEAALGYKDATDAIDVRRAFDGAEILQSGCVKVTFVGGLKNDDMGEEADNELDEYHEYEDGSDDDSDDMDCL